jgi:DNA-3-methyladenine glycosylase
LAKALLGKKLVRLSNKGERLCGIIVETEAYLGHPDKAAHSYKGMTNKNEPMFMDPGTAYVYHIHSYCCMNISSKGNRKNILLYSQLTSHPAFYKHVLLQKNQLSTI